MTISMGPQHPSMHGVYRAVLDLDGEVIVAVRPEIGNLHRGVEKLCEERTYHQIIPLTDRLDYISGFAMNHGFCEAAEKLMQVEVPPRGQYIRTIASELCRISNHIMWLGVHIMDLGTQTFFTICFRDREYVLDLFEMLTGARLTHSFARIGGVAKDLPDGFEHRCRKVIEFLPKRVAEYERIVKHNRIYYKRTKGVGIFTADDCYAWRVTGPPLRSAGVARDLRKDEPYAAYAEVDFEVAVEYNADVYDRFLVRMKEIRESCKIVRQCLDQMPDGDFICSRRGAHAAAQAGCHARVGGDDPGLQPGVSGPAGSQGRGLPRHRGAEGRDGRLHPFRGRSTAVSGALRHSELLPRPGGAALGARER